MKVEKSSVKHGLFHKLFTIIASTVVVSGVVLGIWFFIFYRNHEETNDAQVEQYVTPINTRITGYVQEVLYQENQLVHQGDTLIIIDNREYKAHLDLALAEIENAKNSVGVMQKNVQTTHSDIGIRQSQLAAAKTNIWKTEQEYKRYIALQKEEAATEQQVETVKAAYEVALARFQEINRAIQFTELSTSEASAKVPMAETVIQSKQALVDNAKLYLSYTIITAPYDGWVGKKTIQPGQLVKEGQVLASIVSKEKWIIANFKETQIQYLKEGQQITFKTDALGNKVFNGEIESFSPASGARFSLLPPDNATGNFVKIEQRIPIRIKLTNEEDEVRFLRAGMNVIVVADHQ